MLSGAPEVGYLNEQRYTPSTVSERAGSRSLNSIPTGSHWVAVGGARGITARAALAMAKQFGLQMHLIGSSPQPQLPDAWASLDVKGRKQLKKQVTREALAAGELPNKRWHRIEKDFEITNTLRAYAEAELPVSYHQCDAADWDQLDETLAEIRRLGPIAGILQGAGVSAQKRFEDKTAANLEAMVGVKLDATVALMELTKNDPLKFFVGFGSISGRIGANGATDYGLGADMMCKLIGRFRHQRPEVCSVGFHWHAWGEVGMMVRPANFGARSVMKLALMSPAEGTRHIVNELLVGGPQSEVMFTTDADGEHVAVHKKAQSPRVEELFLIDSLKTDGNDAVAELTFDPVADPFLREHRVKDRPILPMVMAIEAMAEAASLLGVADQRVVQVEDVTIVEPMRLLSDEKVAARVFLEPVGGRFVARLTSDFCNQRGKLLKKDRVQMTGSIVIADKECLLPATPPQLPEEWRDIWYPRQGSGYLSRSNFAVPQADVFGRPCRHRRATYGRIGRQPCWRELVDGSCFARCLLLFAGDSHLGRSRQRDRSAEADRRLANRQDASARPTLLHERRKSSLRRRRMGL